MNSMQHGVCSMISNVLIRSDNTVDANLNRLWHEIDSDSNGILKEEKFVETMSENEVMRERSARRIFELMDSDKSSYVTYSEFVTASID